MPDQPQIWWDDTPPLAAHVPVVSVKPSVGLVVVAVGPVIGVWTHWHPDIRQSRPCRGHNCPVCVTQRPRWKGYLPAERPSRARLVVEVSHGAVRALPQLLRQEICGRWLKFARRGKQSNSSVLVQLSDAPAIVDVSSFDVRLVLLGMWELPAKGGGS